MVRSTPGEVTNTSWENIPQQIHVSRLPSGSLSLGPGQLAVVPVTFLPRYPDSEKDMYPRQSASTTSPPISSAARADLADLIGESAMASFDILKQAYSSGSSTPRRRNNLDWASHQGGNKFEVKTSIVIDSSRGVLQVPITASSTRDNPYSIPDIIRFHHSRSMREDGVSSRTSSSGLSMTEPSISPTDGAAILSAVPFHHDDLDKVTTRKHPKIIDAARDCYDVYMSNPSLDTDLEVVEVLISRPDLMSVEVDPSRLALQSDLMTIPLQPAQVAREWTEEGPLYIPPDSVDNYVVTVCTAPTGVVEDPIAVAYLEEMSNWIDTGNQEESLGFVQIRTDQDTLFIVVDRYLEKVEDEPLTTAPLTPGGSEDSIAEVAPNASRSILESSSSLLKASPNQLAFQFISSKSPPLTNFISLQNKSPVAIRIMRVAVSIDEGKDASTRSIIEYLGLQINATQNTNYSRVEIPATGFLENAIMVSCRVNSQSHSRALHRASFNFTGSIVVRGTMDTDLNYENWKEAIIGDPSRDMHVTAEIPYKVSVLNGRIEVTLERSTHPYPQLYESQGWDSSGRVISALFFPSSQFDSPVGSEAPLPSQRYLQSKVIAHDLRVMSNMAISLTLDSVQIVDENGHGIQSNEESPCSRFNVSIVKAPASTKKYTEFEDLGHLSFQYKFGLRREVAAPVLPTHCFLSLELSPIETGIHQIPVVVYPALLDITDAGQREVSEPTEDGSSSSVIVGLTSVFTWMHSSKVGRAFFQVLNKEQDRTSLGTSRSFKKYLLELAKVSGDEIEKNLQPILVKVGALQHGGMSRSSLLFTNYNPVPIQISIDVGSLEGVSIELGNDGGTSNQGKTIFDFLPKIDGANAGLGKSILSKGSLKGHSVDGLRHFLLSNSEALSLAKRFPRRAAISLSHHAIARYPGLKRLYRLHSFASFSTNTKSNDSTVSPSGFCTLSAKSKKLRAGLGSVPIMLSDDKAFVHQLHQCPTNSVQTPPQTVVIPPGGVARFEITVQSPPAQDLQTDISQLVVTGLVLSTTFGQVMPIIAYFDALQGQLKVLYGAPAKDNSSEFMHTEGLSKGSKRLDVPLTLDWQSPTDKKYIAADNDPMGGASRTDFQNAMSNPGTPLLMTSSFRRPVRLLDVESSNPWSRVSIWNATNLVDTGAAQGTTVGEVRSTALCAQAQGESNHFPSFYQCILNWLANRHKLQSTECGSFSSIPSDGSSRAASTTKRSLLDIIGSIEIAKNTTEHQFAAEDGATSRQPSYDSAMRRAFLQQPKGTQAIKTGRKRSRGIISTSSLAAYAEAWYSLQVASASGLTQLCSRLRATVQYDTSNSEISGEADMLNSSKLSISIPDVEIHSKIEVPKLFIAKNIEDISGESTASVFHFPSTIVGSVVAMTIPLNNPTSVPIRVRLAVASTSTPTTELDSNALTAQESFLQSLESPYVQDGGRKGSEENRSHQLWWEGGGGYFLSDERGDLIRSHHNVSIRAGGGALVSLVSPSLHSISAFVVGCGSRCGMEGESKKNELEYDMRWHSVIGASAAASVTLIGRHRSTLPQQNELSNDEPFIAAGGNPTPGSNGPDAFAIPFSGLDEVILPPFGSAKIGPIYFRPPGRAPALGCNVARTSGARYWGVQSKSLCGAEYFSALVLLENTLTGLERIELRGMGQIEDLHFTDTLADDGSSDIEMRNGRPTLILSQRVNEVPSSQVLYAKREILLFNGGDVSVVIRSIYFSDTSRKPPRSGTFLKTCRLGSFRLLGCFLPGQPHLNSAGKFVESAGHEIKLEPGESHNLVIGYHTGCNDEESHISINVDYMASGGIAGSNEKPSTFNRGDETSRRAELIVGCAMNSVLLSSLAPTPISAELLNSTAGLRFEQTGNISEFVSFRTNSRAIGISSSLLDFCSLIFCALSILYLIAMMFSMRRNLPIRAHMRPWHMQGKEAIQSGDKKRPSQRSIWDATFRCLARADPSSPELQTIGREQIRQVVTSRYRAKGGSPPASLAGVGFLVRERAGVVPGGAGRQRTSKDGGNGSERVRTLSDALFREFSPEERESTRSMLPVGLGWRVAFARGIINEKSIIGSAFEVASKRNDRLTPFDSEPEAISDLINEDEHLLQQDNQSAPQLTSPEKKTQQKRIQPVSQSRKAVAENSVSRENNGETQELEDDWITMETKKTSDRGQKLVKQADDIPASSTRPNRDLHSTIVPSSKSASSTSSPRGMPSGGSPRKNRLEASATKASKAVEDKASTRSSIAQQRQKTKGLVPRVEKTLPKEDSVPAQSTRMVSNKKSDEGRKTPPSKEKMEAKPDASRGNGKKRGKRGKDTKNGNRTMSSPEKYQLMPPPPGLAPPPGFGQEMETTLIDKSSKIERGSGVVAEAATLGDMLTAALNSDMELNDVLGGRSSLPFQGEIPPHGDTIFESNHVRQMADGGSEANDLHFAMQHSPSANMAATLDSVEERPVASRDPVLEALLHNYDETRNEFDVMDFLDSILDDGGSQDQPSALSPSGLLPGAADAPLMSNPWATEKKSSRAAAYGITVEESEGGDDSHSGPFPLLTPAAILMSEYDETDGDEQDKAYTFYARLTDDEE